MTRTSKRCGPNCTTSTWRCACVVTARSFRSWAPECAARRASWPASCRAVTRGQRRDHPLDRLEHHDLGAGSRRRRCPRRTSPARLLLARAANRSDRFMKALGRLFTAMITPFDESGAVNVAEAVRIAKFLVDRGNDGLIVSGTTGESPALENEEKLELFAGDQVGARANRGTVIAGTTGNNTHHAVELTKAAEKSRRRRRSSRSCRTTASRPRTVCCATSVPLPRQRRCRSSSTIFPGARTSTCCRRRCTNWRAAAIRTSYRHQRIERRRRSVHRARARPRARRFHRVLGRRLLLPAGVGVGRVRLRAASPGTSCSRELVAMANAFDGGDVEVAGRAHLLICRRSSAHSLRTRARSR